MAMSREVEQKLNNLHYNGSAQEQYDFVTKVLKEGVRYDDVIDTIIERLTTADLEDLIQAHCA